MKNKINILLLGIALLFLNTSCEDFLKEESIDEISEEYVYTTEDGLQVAVYALYNYMRINNFPTDYSDGLKANAFFMVGTDLGLTRTWFDPYGTVHTATAFPDDKWTVPYKIIDRANAIITNAPKINMDSDTRDNLVAQARAIRGELYFDLIRMYDNILLDTIATTPENAFDPVTYEVADPAKVYELIDSDLDFAIAHLDWVVPSGTYGQGVVRHLRGQSAMWQNDWDEAVIQFDAIINDETHHLVDLDEVFGQNANNAEALYAYQRQEDIGGDDGMAGGGSTVFCSFFNNRLYEMNSGELIRTVDNGGQALGWAYPNDYLKSLYDQDHDLRFSTYYYPLQLYVNNPDKANYGEPLPASSYDNDFRHYHWSLKKYHDTDKDPNTDKSFKSIIYYRYAETLLLGAEAHWRQDNENPTNTYALKYVNEVRERAGLAAYPFTTFDRDSYLEESARELALEKNRWFLLKRMGLLVERQNMYYQFGSNSNNVALRPMRSYMVRLPIPQSQIELMGTFPQNEGY